jgi:hypothetical protein
MLAYRYNRSVPGRNPQMPDSGISELGLALHGSHFVVTREPPDFYCANRPLHRRRDIRKRRQVWPCLGRRSQRTAPCSTPQELFQGHRALHGYRKVEGQQQPEQLAA